MLKNVLFLSELLLHAVKVHPNLVVQFHQKAQFQNDSMVVDDCRVYLLCMIPKFQDVHG